MSLPDDEEQIDAKIKETDRAIADLQKVRQELFQKKKTFASRPRPSSSNPAPISPSLTPPPAQPNSSEKEIEKAMNMLEWKSFKKKDGEWAFMRNRDGSLLEDLRPIVDFIDLLRKGRQLVVGKYRYEASEDKFLSRYYSAK